METTQFAGFTWPKQEWSLPKGRPAARVGKKRYTSGYFQNAPCMAGKGEIGFYWGEGGEPSGRLWTLRVAKQHDLGWYTNSFEDEMLHGFALRLPGGRGFLAGWTMGDGMCASLDRHIYDDLKDALMAGNDMARDAAENMCEADQQDQADQQINQAEHDIGEAQEVIELCEKELEAMRPCYHLIAEGVLVERIQQEQATIQKLQGRITLLQCEPWRAVA